MRVLTRAEMREKFVGSFALSMSDAEAVLALKDEFLKGGFDEVSEYIGSNGRYIAFFLHGTNKIRLKYTNPRQRPIRSFKDLIKSNLITEL